jgi:uncharacterized protein (DUF433 family)
MFDLITSDPAVLGGKPCLRDTRISVEMVLEWIATGGTPDTIHATYPHVSADAVSQAVRYASRFLENEILIDIRRAA